MCFCLFDYLAPEPLGHEKFRLRGGGPAGQRGKARPPFCRRASPGRAHGTLSVALK